MAAVCGALRVRTISTSQTGCSAIAPTKDKGRTAHRGQRLYSGQRSVVSGQWSAVSGQRSAVSGPLIGAYLPAAHGNSLGLAALGITTARLSRRFVYPGIFPKCVFARIGKTSGSCYLETWAVASPEDLSTTV